ncbi:MAG TPA: glycosyltransferase, partial [Acidimicrobiales bacterium]
MLSTLFTAANLAGSFVIGLSSAYFAVALASGIRTYHRAGHGLGQQSDIPYGAPFDGLADTSGYHLYFLVPCLNEAAVIGSTVRALAGGPEAVAGGGPPTIVVIDDASDDGTAEVTRAAGDGVVIVRRDLPDARKGKGAGLNDGFAFVTRDVRERGLDHDRVIVCVMDADGRLSDGACRHVLPLFDDPDVGGVQLAVRIRNRETNFLLKFQAHQFWTLSALSQMGRLGVGTVSLGGNGQFARLTALEGLGAAPWSNSLTEDLDLAVSLAIDGWRLASTPDAAVDQQGVEELGRLFTQRTRWYQGHMMTAKRLPAIWRAPGLSHGAALEMTLYILVPWLFDLPWSILC